MAAAAHLVAVWQNRVACARRLAAARANQHHVRNVNRAFLFQNTALYVLRRIRAGVLLDHARVLDRHGLRVDIYRQHLAGATLGAAGNHLYLVAVANADRRWFNRWSWHRRYHTSGASEMILVNFLSRSSRATGPNTRVPTGSFASLIKTAALSSNRMYVPSLRRCSLRVRTTTAFTTVPFFTCVSGVASFTAAVIMSPNPAVKPASPPTGRMHVNWRAPELSATVSHVRICTIALLPLNPVERVAEPYSEFRTTLRASNAAVLPSTATASAWTTAASKRSPLCPPPSLRRSHRARNTSSRAAPPGDTADAAPRALPSPRWSSASWCW